MGGTFTKSLSSVDREERGSRMFQKHMCLLVAAMGRMAMKIPNLPLLEDSQQNGKKERYGSTEEKADEVWRSREQSDRR
jgi:hypothetical protein